MRYLGYKNNTKALVGLITLFYASSSIIPTVAQTTSSESAKETTSNLVLPDNPLSLKEVAQITLENSSAILQARLTAEIAKASYRMAKGQFNLTTSVSSGVTRSRPLPGGLPDNNSQNLNGTLSKFFRSGVQSSLTIGADRLDLLPSPPDRNTTKINLNATLPLLKGRGYASAAANETAAKQESQAGEFTFYHNVSSVLKEAINAYWTYKAAIYKAKTQQESEERVLKWGEEAGKAALQQEKDPQQVGKKYATEISYLEGYLADKRRNIIESTRQVDTAKGALAITMGIPAEQLSQIGFPAEEFPGDWRAVLIQLEQHPMQAKWQKIAMDKRFDLQASKLQQQSAMTKLTKARQDILPQLDAGLNYSYNSLEFGNGLDRYSFTSDMRGNDTMVSLNFIYPLGNDTAKGQRDLASATYQIQTSQVNNLIRTIYLQIDTATTELMGRLKAVEGARKAIETYLPSVEKLKQANQNLAVNPGAIVNLIELEDRLNQAGLDYIDALLGLAQAVTELRFQTGTLITPSQTEAQTITLEDNLTKLPGIQNNL
jgi:outer membrane protein